MGEVGRGRSDGRSAHRPPPIVDLRGMGAGAAAESAASPTGTGRLGRAASDRGAIDVALYYPPRPPRSEK